MRTTLFSDFGGLGVSLHLGRDPPGQSHRIQRTPDTDLLERDPRRSMGPGSQTGSDIIRIPHLKGTLDQAVRQEVTSYRDNHVDRMADTPF